MAVVESRPLCSLIYFCDLEGRVLMYPDSIKDCVLESGETGAYLNLVSVDDIYVNHTIEVKSINEASSLLVSYLNKTPWMYPKEFVYTVHLRHMINRLLRWGELSSGSSVAWLRKGLMRDVVDYFYGEDYLTVVERQNFDVVYASECLDFPTFNQKSAFEDTRHVLVELTRRIHGGYVNTA